MLIEIIKIIKVTNCPWKITKFGSSHSNSIGPNKILTFNSQKIINIKLLLKIYQN